MALMLEFGGAAQLRAAFFLLSARQWEHQPFCLISIAVLRGFSFAVAMIRRSPSLVVRRGAPILGLLFKFRVSWLLTVQR